MGQRQALYMALVAARVLLALSPAYIHPDEYFQAPEIAASDILGVDALRTWEFTAESPIRSIVPIHLFSGTPLIVLKLIQRLLAHCGCLWELTPWLLFCSTRIFACMVSFAVDICVVRAIQRQYPGARVHATRALLATSYCLAVFHSHTFANSFASAVLALSFDLLSNIESNAWKPASRSTLIRVCALLGVSLAFGTFTHISFPMFALPIGLVAAIMLLRARSRAGLATMGVGGLLTALLITLVDSLYYGTLQLRIVDGIPHVSGTLTCTVLNNVFYNSNHENLATHGIHSRLRHLLISVPTLFGPLAILAVLKLWAFVKFPSMQNHVSFLTASAAVSALSGLGILSLAPHQEPRFLMPMFPALAICTWRWHRMAPGYFWRVWIAFNVVLAVGYGVVHQAGVVPAIAFISRTSSLSTIQCRLTAIDSVVCADTRRAFEVGEHVNNPRVKTRVLLFASYMAPRHLLAQPEFNGSYFSGETCRMDCFRHPATQKL
ncbi:alpha 1,2 mannosyltransferase [Coemansia sp. RSA 2705]|nr:alpha 1,2 mannosyltransferase [Coemansia sp. RSA 2705]